MSHPSPYEGGADEMLKEAFKVSIDQLVLRGKVVLNEERAAT